MAAVISPRSETGRVRLDFLDGIRALAALFVMFNHSFRMPYPNLIGGGEHHPEGWLFALTGWSRYGHFAVTVFILLSGFCLMIPVAKAGGDLRGGTLFFYKRRAWRILPTYYAALAVSLALIAIALGQKTGSQWDACLPVTAKGILSRLLLLQDVWVSQQINNPFWSIAVEWRIYFLFPLLLVLFARFGPVPTTTAAVVLFTTIHYLTSETRLRGCMPCYVGVFVLGMFGAQVVFGRDGEGNLGYTRIPWGALSAILIGGVVAACALHPLSWSEQHLLALDMVLGLGSMAAIIAIARRPAGLIHRAISWRPLVWIGGFSYSVYLIHFPLQALVWRYLIMPLKLSPPAGLALIWFPGHALVLAGAFLFFLAFERPIVRAMSKAAKSTKTTS